MSGSVGAPAGELCRAPGTCPKSAAPAPAMPNAALGIPRWKKSFAAGRRGLPVRGDNRKPHMSRRSVLVIGSGPIIIGQAAEFDYAGVQACRALARGRPPGRPRQLEPGDDHDRSRGRRRGVPRAAHGARRSSGSSPANAPDALLPTLGGQTGLNLAVELAEAGVIDKLRGRTARHAARYDQAGRRPRTLQGQDDRDRRAGPGQRRRHRHRGRRGVRQRARATR